MSFARSPWLRWLAWSIVVALSLAALSRTTISTDITAFLPGPATRAQALLAEQLRDGVAARLMLIGIDVESESGAPQAAALSRVLTEALRSDARFAYVQNGAGFDAELAALLDARYLLSAQVTPEAFSVDGLRASFARLESLLRSSAAPLVNRIAARDPTGELLALFGQFGADARPPTRDGLWFTRDGRTALVLAQTAAAGFDVDGQATAMAAVQAAFDAAASRTQAKATLQLAGPGVFAVQSREAIERDAERLSILAVALIALLMLAALRSPRFLLFAVLPVGTGVLAGLAVVAAGFGAIHGITLGFGITLVGEAIDYAVYVQVQRVGSAADPRRLWRALWLAVLTSAAGFVSMMLSGFQGLVQLGLFSLVGLATAALIARYLLPSLLAPLAPARLQRFAWLERVAAAAPRARGAVLAASLAAAALLIWRAPALWNDELAAISPLARASGELDARLRGDLGLPDLRWLVAIDAPTRDAALAQAEALVPALNRLRDAGAIAGFDSPTTLLPSAAVQRARQQALPDAEALRARLERALADGNFRIEAFEPFIADVAAARTRALLAPADFAGTGLGQRLSAQLVDHAGGATVLVTLHGVADEGALRSAVAAQPGALLVDLKNDVEALIADYRQRAAVAALGGLTLIVLLLLWQVPDRRAAFRIAAALACAVVITAAIVLLVAGRLTLFHLVALLLVVGVGSNYALFFGTLVADAAERAATRLSVLLCAASTLIAFALLATSATPVLHMIGLTVAAGVVVSFVTSLVLASPPASSTTSITR